MSPAEAADALSEMEESAMAGILGELKDEPKSEVEELLEFREDTAGGMMDTDYVALPAGATAAEALAQVKANAELMEGLNVILLEDESGRLAGVVPIARLLAADPLAPLASLAGDELIRADTSAKAERITELFDKYNLITLPVTHKDGRLAGVITADDVISVLRSR
jgi:Mg/Co/Ni transporter MgtE